VSAGGYIGVCACLRPACKESRWKVIGFQEGGRGRVGGKEGGREREGTRAGGIDDHPDEAPD
jgi:hypothetical protein